MAARKKKGGPSLDPSRFILNNLGFIAFLGALALTYIANAHYAEYNVRRIQSLETEIQEQEWLLRTLKSDNMFNGLRSEVAQNVRDDGLRMHRGRPKKLVVSN